MFETRVAWRGTGFTGVSCSSRDSYPDGGQVLRRDYGVHANPTCPILTHLRSKGARGPGRRTSRGKDLFLQSIGSGTGFWRIGNYRATDTGERRQLVDSAAGPVDDFLDAEAVDHERVGD